jgi:hypothetical protein
MRVACAYIEGLDTREVASGSVESACASMSSMDGGCSPFSSTDSPAVVVDPRAALDTAHKLTKKAGSATACVVQLCPEQKALIAANLVGAGVGSAHGFEGSRKCRRLRQQKAAA